MHQSQLRDETVLIDFLGSDHHLADSKSNDMIGRDFYNLDCPENLSEDEEPELGLGELLEEHRAHFFMEKLSGNFSTNEV